MKTATEIDKLELAKWLINLEDKNILKEIELLMKQHSKTKYDADYEATLSDEEKVIYWKETGHSIEEARRISKEKIAKWKERINKKAL